MYMVCARACLCYFGMTLNDPIAQCISICACAADNEDQIASLYTYFLMTMTKSACSMHEWNVNSI